MPEADVRTTPLLTARGLRLVVGGKTLLGGGGGLDLDIREGKRTMIMGANGAGKSLLLRLLHGLVQPSAGQVLWQGRGLDKRARRDQAMVFQRPVRLRRSVRANLRFALGVGGVRGTERTRREREALEIARLDRLAARPARVLSGGEQQRLALARALACAPKVLFLDEPTASLDPASTRDIEALISEAHGRGVTIVFVTHDAGQARRMGDDIVFLHEGRVAEMGPATGVLDSPQSPAARAWLEGRLYTGDDA